jgi:excisionase family DNA binding protein
MSTMPVADFLNVQEVADLLGCTDARVRQMLIAKEIKGVKANARAWMVHRKEATRVANQERRKGGRRRIGDDD